MEDYYNEVADECNDLDICTEMEKRIPKKRAVTDILNFERLNLKEGPIQYGYFINKQRLLQKLYGKEDTKECTLFSKDSIIAKDNKDAVNPAFYLSPAFTRYAETGKDEMHLSDSIVYSNEIYKKFKENPTPSRLFGPIKKFITGVIMDYLDYDFLIRKVRYLNKSFIVFTQENCHYSSQMLRKAYLKVSLKEMFEGKVRMPILNHPYYTNCTKLTIIYQTCNKTENTNLIKEYDSKFMKELFEYVKFFPMLKELKIVVSHSQVIEFDKQNLSQHYKYLIFSTQLTSIERLIISDTRLMIDWKIFQLMSPDDFPYLKYLELPNNCFYDFNSSPNTPIQEFPNLHLKFFISVDNNQEFYNGLKSRFYNRFAPQETKWEETNCLSLIKCDKLQLDVPLHEGIYSNLFASFNHIDISNFLAHDKYGHMKDLKKWCFKNAKFSNNAFDASRNMAHILVVRDKTVSSKNSTDRTVEDFEEYDFFDEYVDPLEEFVAPYNSMTDHCLYILTHSPSFENLKIIDLRANPISSLKTLIAKGRGFYAPKLEELYLDTTVEDAKESQDISFFFNGYVDRLTKLKVLYIESKENPLVVNFDDEIFQVTNLAYNKLYLRNISFLKDSGQKLFDNLQLCEELVIDHCKFEMLDVHKAFMNLILLKSLSIGDKYGESIVLLDSLKWTPHLMNSLKILKLSNLKSNNIFDIISKLKNIFQIVLVNIDFTKQVFNQSKNKLFSMKLNKLDLYKCKISCQSFLSNLFLTANNITDLCMLDNKFDETGGSGKKRKNSAPLELPKIARLTIDDTYLSLQGKSEQWDKVLSIFPNVEDLLYYKRKLKTKLPAQFAKTNQPITSIVKLINSGMTKIRKFTQIKNLPNDYHSDPGHATPKVRGLFEYRFDPYTTIDHFD